MKTQFLYFCNVYLCKKKEEENTTPRNNHMYKDMIVQPVPVKLETCGMYVLYNVLSK